jgi:hypothetical protein
MPLTCFGLQRPSSEGHLYINTVGSYYYNMFLPLFTLDEGNSSSFLITFEKTLTQWKISTIVATF